MYVLSGSPFLGRLTTIGRYPKQRVHHPRLPPFRYSLGASDNNRLPAFFLLI